MSLFGVLLKLMDRLEGGLKSTSRSLILEESFRGSLMHQMISRECNHTSESEEPTYMLSLTVQNKSNLYQSLDLYVEGSLCCLGGLCSFVE